jgi:hypothetical protein
MRFDSPRLNNGVDLCIGVAQIGTGMILLLGVPVAPACGP